MAITLAEAKELSQDKLTNYVIDEFIKSPLLDVLPFDDTVKPQGGSTLTYVYNRVSTQPTADTREINSEYTPQETKTKQHTVNLKIFGGAFEVDRVIINDERQVVDHIKFQLEQKVKATRAVFHDLFINGDSSAKTTAFDGLTKALGASSTVITPEAAIDLSGTVNIDNNWKAFLDALRKMRAKMDGAPTLYLMNSEMYGVFQSVMDRAGINLAGKDNYGDEVAKWGNSLVMSMGDKAGTSKPIIDVSEAADTEGETSIYAVRLGLDGVHGVSPSGSAIVNTYVPNLSLPGAVKKGEVEMVAALALKTTKAAGILKKIKIA
ncbi:MAG: phage capsid protein [Bacillota bacterium]|nr:phage capsid protein [Bacillota bacterium]